MQPEKVFERYQELQQYIGWTDEDARLVYKLSPFAQPHFELLIEDFYRVIERNPTTAKAITGGTEQLTRLKRALFRWLAELFSGRYDQAYVLRRWQVGLRHVQIGLDHVYTNAAVSRLRSGLLLALEHCKMPDHEALAARRSLNKLLDLDLAIMEDAYHTEFVGWQNRKERERFLHAERLAAIGETMTGLVHESRNMLQRSRACLEMLEVDVSDRPPALDLVRRIRNAQDDLHQLFEEVREYAAPLKLNRSDCNLAPIWQKAWKELTAIDHHKELRLTELVEPEIVHAIVDSFAFGQVFRNIFENAIQASPDRGKITIRCLQRSVDGSQEVQIQISDQGPGIPLEDRQRVLEPFFTTKTKGTGLGLAIARRIVESHGGHIEVGASPVGTLIQIQLPQV
jgi:signal transduction histidine kinase